VSTRRRLAVVAAAVVAGGVLAAVGVMPPAEKPLPPKQPGIEVVESGSPEARAAGEVLPPPVPVDDPFAPAIPIVESGSQAARDLVGEEFERLQNPFELPPIPVVESGTDEAWIAHGEEFINVAELERLAERRRQAEATFNADSRFPRNPESERGLYRFDLRLLQLVDSSRGLDRITYFANTADGSLLFPDWAMQGLLPPGTYGDGELHFVIRQADGDVLACGRHPDFGEACLMLGENLGSAFAWLRDMSLHRQFLDSIPRTPQTLGEGPGGNVQGVRGRGDGIHLQMWVSRNPSTIATQVPVLGAGVGVMKDHRIRANRIVHRTRWEGGDLDGGDLVIDLIEMEPALMERDTSRYHFVTAFTAEGLAEAMAIGQQAPELMAQARAIAEALAACPQGRAGSDCRKFHRERMKALNEGLRDQALDFGRRHGLPVDAP
jgi:hypothetical protein